MSPLLDLSLRVLAAAFVGAVIGYEREIRAKGAGMRTHVLVALGSALFMIVSQFGFDGAPRFDAARVAAGVVGGLGFLGGGIIMKTKNHVSGLTTAAGLWVTGSLGLAVGCGMYALSGICLVLVLVCLEVQHQVRGQGNQRRVLLAGPGSHQGSPHQPGTPRQGLFPLQAGERLQG